MTLRDLSTLIVMYQEIPCVVLYDDAEVTSSAPAKTSEAGPCAAAFRVIQVGGEAIKLAQTDRPLPKCLRRAFSERVSQVFRHGATEIGAARRF